jgi:hypothetical protein
MTPSTGLTILSILALLGTAGLVALSAAAALLGVLRKRPQLTKLGLIGGIGLGGLYLVVLTGIGLLSRNRTLPVGMEKYFCEIDCHLAYSVTGLRRVVEVPRALGTVWAVTIRTRFDEQTISSHRSREAPLSPNPRRVALVANDGREHEPLEVSAEELARLGVTSVPLTRELRPGESYTTTVLFDLPAASTPIGLLLTEGIFVSRLLIGGERSPFHGQTLLALPEPTLAAVNN